MMSLSYLIKAKRLTDTVTFPASEQSLHAEALRIRLEAIASGSDEVCPLTQQRICELADKDLFLASDRHVYARSGLRRYLRDSHRRGQVPRSPLTGQPVTDDTVRLLHARTYNEMVDAIAAHRLRTHALTTLCLVGSAVGFVASYLLLGGAAAAAHDDKTATAPVPQTLCTVAHIGKWAMVAAATFALADAHGRLQVARTKQAALRRVSRSLPPRQFYA